MTAIFVDLADLDQQGKVVPYVLKSRFQLLDDQTVVLFKYLTEELKE